MCSNIDGFLSVIVNIIQIITYIYAIYFAIYRQLKIKYNKKRYRPQCITEEEVEKYTKIFIQTRLKRDNEKMCNHKFVNKLIKTTNQYYFILGDTGTGKSSFLLNSYFYFIHKMFKHGYSIHFVSLRDSDALNGLIEIENKKNVILFLDAFDEAIYATQNLQEMFNKLENATKEFSKIVVTSRIHFFDNEIEEPSNISNMKAIDLEDSKYQKYFICPFTNMDIILYLFKKYKLNLYKQCKAFNIIEQCNDLMSRPLILSYIDLLLDNKNDIKYSYEVYEIIINSIIKREIQFIIKSLRSTKSKDELFKDYLIFLENIAIQMYYNIIIYGEPIIDSHMLNSNKTYFYKKYKKRNRTLLERKYNNFFSFSHRSIFEYFIAKNITKIQNFRFDKNLNQIYIFIAEMYEAGNENVFRFIKESSKEWRRNIELFDTQQAKLTYNMIPKNEILFEFINWDTKSFCMKLLDIIDKIRYLQKFLYKIGNTYAINRFYELNIVIHNEIQEKKINSLLNELPLQDNSLKILIVIKSIAPMSITIIGEYNKIYEKK